MVNFSGFPGSAMKSTKGSTRDPQTSSNSTFRDINWLACAQNLYCKENAHPRPQEVAVGGKKTFEEDQQTKSETPQKIHPQDVQCYKI